MFLDEIIDDLARRDFTINAIAIDPIERQLVDPFHGQRDLGAGVIRAVGTASERFAEDGLRVLRGGSLRRDARVSSSKATRCGPWRRRARSTRWPR